jgi:hypothetical protein
MQMLIYIIDLIHHFKESNGAQGGI